MCKIAYLTDSFTNPSTTSLNTVVYKNKSGCHDGAFPNITRYFIVQNDTDKNNIFTTYSIKKQKSHLSFAKLDIFCIFAFGKLPNNKLLSININIKNSKEKLTI